MHLVIDVGNTETALGLYRGQEMELIGHWRVSTPVPRTADEYHLLLRTLLEERGFSAAHVARVVLGSVVPDSTKVLRETLGRLSAGRVYVVTAESDLPVRLDVEEPRTVGADRIVNTLAASGLYGRDTIAVDLGTATTFDCISAEGVFLGGVIAPGVPAGLEWLSRRTAMLPRVELLAPEAVIGRRTEACLHSGIFYAAVDGVDGIVRRIKEEWEKPEAYVVATGGLAEAIGPHLRSVDHLEPFLTLHGLEMAGRYMAKSDT
jgi:type III pantothenate kinase